MLQKLEGIVLRTIDYGESGKILTIFTREKGKIGAVARGAKKPNSRLASVSQPFTYGYYLCSVSTGLSTLQQGEIIDSFRHVKEDLFLTAYTSYIVELMDKSMEERSANPFLFELLLQTMKYIDGGLDAQILKNIFEIKMLSVLGQHLYVDGCANCGATDGNFAFSLKEQGILCERCVHLDRSHLKISQRTVRLLRLFLHLDINRLGNINVKPVTKYELELCISAFYEEYSGLYLKSKKFLKQMEQLK
ncbi:DNA repair protein RecO [Bacillus kwashiorkori]|uniref:DNA repair protein RecO n=1 Tax=Bacillus kwashiorkori TaxID=1522318 RepID=UPI000784AFBF|nr:DNA repair protein RecO [Bacillus kwashiorkori]